MTEDRELLAFFKLFSDVERLKIAGMLATRPASPDELVAALDLPLADILHHLGRLHKAGFVRSDGHAYSFQTKVLEDLAHRILAQASPLPAGAEDLDDFDRKVVADFCDAEGRLTGLPSQQKKFQAILHYVVKPFEPNKRYSEKEINLILARFHPDTAALRRGLVDYRLMARQAGVYWLLEE